MPRKLNAESRRSERWLAWAATPAGRRWVRIKALATAISSGEYDRYVNGLRVPKPKDTPLSE